MNLNLSIKAYRKIVECWRERWRVTIVNNDVDGHFSFEARNVAVSEVSAEFMYLNFKSIINLKNIDKK